MIFIPDWIKGLLILLAAVGASLAVGFLWGWLHTRASYIAAQRAERARQSTINELALKESERDLKEIRDNAYIASKLKEKLDAEAATSPNANRPAFDRGSVRRINRS